MIAEKILDEGWPSNYWVRDVITKHSLAAIQTYADFFYWLGKEGWKDFGNDEWAKGSFDQYIFSLEQLYQTYLTNSKPKE